MSGYTSSQWDDHEFGDDYLAAHDRSMQRRIDRAHDVSWETGFVEGALVMLAACSILGALAWWLL